MVEKTNVPSKNPIIYILVVLLVVAAFFIGTLYTKVKTLEEGKGTSPTDNKTAQTTPVAPTFAPLAVSDNDPSQGPKDAKVTLVVFSDYQCPFCGAFSGLNQEIISMMKKRDTTWEPTESNFIKDYVKTGKGRLVFKNYPFLDQGTEARESHIAAIAAECANEQGKFWEYHDYLFSHQKGENEGTFSKDNLKKFAGILGLKAADFATCLESGKYDKALDEAVAFGQSVGVNGTPASFVNGKLVGGGAVPYSQVKQAVEAALK
ncbi:MAG: DsbA family protein [Candidatus Gottesmanbacteria bacterium]